MDFVSPALLAFIQIVLALVCLYLCTWVLIASRQARQSWQALRSARSTRGSARCSAGKSLHQ
jgi:hypothetical protein